MPRRMGAALAVQAAGALLLGAGGAVCALAGRSVGAGFSSGLAPSVGVDPLSGAFLAVVAVVAAPAAIHAVAGLRGVRNAPGIAALTGLFPIVLAGVLCARDVTTFLACWELMTLVPAAAILLAGDAAPRRRTVFEYLAITHIGGAGVWAAMILLAANGALGAPGGLSGAGTALTATVAVAGIVGFGTKAGLVPLHAWLPRTHPLAPPHVSALMSGAMVAVALYGLARLMLEWVGRPAPWMGVLLLALGAASALAGAAYALFQRDLKRLLAFSTVENMGVAAMALAAGALFLAQDDARWAGVALAAAVLQALAHAAAKALMFLSAGSMDRAGGGLRLDRMGGVLARLPSTGGATAVGALTLAGLPLLGVFAGEWLTLQALLRLGRGDEPVPAVAAGLATAALGATVALAAYAFVMVIGLALLGRPRTPGYRDAREVPLAMRAPVVALAGVCALVGVLPGLLAPRLAALAPGAPDLDASAGLSVPGSSLPTLGLTLALAVAIGAIAALRGRRRALPAPVWNCGQDAAPQLEWTAAAFSKPASLAFGAVLRPRREVAVDAPAGVVRGLRHRGEVPHLFDDRVYAPAARGAMAAALVARRLQSGSLRQYVGGLTALVLALLALVRLGVLG